MSDILLYQIFCPLAPWLLWATEQATSLSIKKCPKLQQQFPCRHNTNTVYRSARLWNDQCRTNLSLSGPWKNKWGSRGVAPPILKLSIKWMWVANVTSLLSKHFIPRPQNNFALARNQTLNYPAYSMVTIPLTVSQPLNVMPVHTKNKTTFWHSNLQMFHTAQVTEHLHLGIKQNFLDLLQHLQRPSTCAAVISWLYICNKNWINLVLMDILSLTSMRQLTQLNNSL